MSEYFVPTPPPERSKTLTFAQMHQQMITPPSPPQPPAQFPMLPPEESEQQQQQPPADVEIIDDEPEEEEEVQVDTEQLQESMQTGIEEDYPAPEYEEFETPDRDSKLKSLELIEETQPVDEPQERDLGILTDPPTEEELVGDDVVQFSTGPKPFEPEQSQPEPQPENNRKDEEPASEIVMVARAIARIKTYLTPDVVGEEMYEVLVKQLVDAAPGELGRLSETVPDAAEQQPEKEPDIRDLLLNDPTRWPVFPEAMSPHEELCCKNVLMSWIKSLGQDSNDNWSLAAEPDQNPAPVGPDNLAFVDVHLTAYTTPDGVVDTDMARMVNYPGNNQQGNRRVVSAAIDKLDTLRNKFAEEESQGRDFEERLVNGKYKERSYTWAVDAENVLMRCFPGNPKDTKKFPHKAALVLALAARPLQFETSENQIGDFAIDAIWKEGGLDVFGTLLEIARLSPAVNDVHVIDSGDAAVKFLSNYGPLIIINNNDDDTKSVLVNISINVTQDKIIYMNMSKDHSPDLIVEEAMPIEQFKQLVEMDSSDVIAIEPARGLKK